MGRSLRSGFVIAAFAVLFAVTYAAWSAALHALVPQGRLASGWFALSAAYWTASFFFGAYAVRRFLAYGNLALGAFLALFVGPVAAPIVVGRAVARLWQVQQLRSLVRTVG